METYGGKNGTQKCKLLFNSFIFNRNIKGYAKEEALNKLNAVVLAIGDGLYWLLKQL